MSSRKAHNLKASFVTPWYGDEIPGGAEAEARRTAQNLAAAGVEVQALTTCLSGLGSDWDRDHYPPGVSREGGVTVRRFATAPRDGALFNQLNQKVCGGARLDAREEHGFYANMVHSPDLLDYIAAHPQDGPFFFIPYLFTSSVWGPLIHPAKSVIIPCLHDEGYARMRSVRRAFEAARAVVFHVPAERDLAAALYDLDQTEPLILGEGVDAEWDADPERFRRKFNLPGPFILYAGRKDAGKNVPLLAHYFVRFIQDGLAPPGLKLVMIGNLPAPIPAGGREHILDLGFVDPQDKYDAYAAAEVLVQPSLMESFSLVIMESWLAGAPVMVHEGCAVTREHALASGGGLHFADYPHFAEGLALLLNRPELNQAMGAAGRRYVLENYSWPVVTRRFVELIERLSQEPTPEPLARAEAVVSPAPAAVVSRGPAVHQMLPDFAYGDAIGNDVLAIQKALRSWGLRSEIFAEHVHPLLKDACLPVEQYQAQASEEDLLLFHFSVGHQLADRLPGFKGRKVMRYHNITPAHFLERSHPEAAERCRQGRRQLAELAPLMELGVGVSDFNCRELEEVGCPETVTVPILMDLDQLGAPPDPGVLARFKGERLNVLHVGRIAPNKCIQDLIKVHYWLSRLIDGVRLHIVGGGGDSPYGRGLRKLVGDLDVPDVYFAGHVSDAEMLAYYRIADLYLCQSEHEGFCVPLVESMHFGLPILAHAAAGVPSTLGQGGVLLAEKNFPLAAEVAARLLTDREMRAALSARARARLERFRPDKVARELKQALIERLGLEALR